MSHAVRRRDPIGVRKPIDNLRRLPVAARRGFQCLLQSAGFDRRPQNFFGAKVLAFAHIRAQKSDNIGIQLVEQLVLADVPHRLGGVAPERFFRIGQRLLARERSQRRTPFRDGAVALPLVPEQQRQAVMRAPQVRIEFQRVAILHQCARGTSTLRVRIRQRGIPLRVRRRALKHRGQVVFGPRRAFRRQIFAVARTIVEPRVAHELLLAIYRWRGGCDSNWPMFAGPNIRWKTPSHPDPRAHNRAR